MKFSCEKVLLMSAINTASRTVATKSKLKVSIIQKVDRKLDLEDIADGLGLEFNELLDEMEAIVYSGTKLDISYYLEDVMDEDYMLDIYDYFIVNTLEKRAYNLSFKHTIFRSNNFYILRTNKIRN